MKGYDCIDGKCQCRYCHTAKPCGDFMAATANPRGHTLQCRTCNTMLRRIRLGSQPRRRLPDRNCYWCGTRLHADHSQAKFCSYPCAYAARRKPDICHVYYLNCTRCGSLFASSRQGRKFCGAGRCEVLRHRVTDRCPDCGGSREFFQTYCEGCRQIRARAGQKRAKRRRRAARKHVLAERIDIAAVYARDGWVCGICRKPVNPMLTHPDPMSASLDHVIPLAMNGSHTYLNTQLAHLQCNLDKRAAPPVVRGKTRPDQVLF